MEVRAERKKWSIHDISDVMCCVVSPISGIHLENRSDVVLRWYAIVMSYRSRILGAIGDCCGLMAFYLMERCTERKSCIDDLVAFDILRADLGFVKDD